jgi:hypothetical protein
MAATQELNAYPLCCYFLAGYPGKKDFPSENVADVLQRHETLLASALQILGLQREALRRRPEFNFDSGDSAIWKPPLRC